MEDWAEIRRLYRAEQMPIRAIARKLGVGRNTVRRALAAQAPPRYQRAVKGSAVDAVEPQIRRLLEQWPTMPATVIAERIGWTRGMTILKDRVRELRPVYTPPDPVSRTVYQPGELAQCDLWFPPVDVPLGAGQVGRPPVLVMVAGYSRVITSRMFRAAPHGIRAGTIARMGCMVATHQLAQQTARWCRFARVTVEVTSWPRHEVIVAPDADQHTARGTEAELGARQALGYLPAGTVG